MRAFLSPLALALVAALASTGLAQGVRQPVFAGSWYPSDPAELAQAIDGYLNEGPRALPEGYPVGLIAPHAGYIYSGPCAGAAFRSLQGHPIRRVIVLAVNHRGPPFRGLSIPPFEAFATPLGQVPVDQKAIATLRSHPLVQELPAAHAREHSLELELPFLQRVIPAFSLVPAVVSALGPGDAASLAKAIKPLLDGQTVVVASSDFTHYGPGHGYVPFTTDIRRRLTALDRGAIDPILALDLPGFLDYRSRTGATICGREPISLLLALLPQDAKGHLVSYYLSADLPHGGDIRQNSVSYAAIVFTK